MNLTNEEQFEVVYQHYLDKGCTASEAGRAAKALLAKVKRQRRERRKDNRRGG